MTGSPIPDWLVPPPEGFFAEDLDHLPDLPAHTELIDGSLVFVSPQKDFHSVIIDVLVAALRRCAPRGLRVRREMSVVLGPRQRPEPDIVILRAGVPSGPDITAYRAEDVLLVIEVVSPDSETRDRERKPQLYAAAGIRHFWRVEQNVGRATVYVYELDPAVGSYSPMGIHHDKLRLTVPFEMDVDLTEIDGL
ncbi:Uma2 family endonuclease [Planomonospora sp. ID91781]|uniref:Restriction endonuclease n=2 Tax=Planomonospora sphaerica TaxID=161355 RepID=A0A171AZS8_9ACTN|nr:MULTISPECIES: Uma2 family endonuclease [Planomonospora]MBG0822360.1 Uma2 family endonuclease [Planomonospora sp. ID91781]GAT64508.1 restriction endonuclease [Planomonospora sphaerica]